jgi:DNA-binding FadR family transcriptional regulator
VSQGAPPRRRRLSAAVEPAAPGSVRIAELLAQAIESGKYPLGSRLPTEAELAGLYEVSRPTIREALSALQFTGYIVSRKGFGSVVRAVHPGDPSGGPVTLDGVIDLLETRAVLEPAAVRRAATSPRRVALVELRRALRGMALAVEYPELHARTDLHLHLRLVEAGSNPHLARAATAVLQAHDGPVWERIRAKTWPSGDDVKAWLEDHRNLADAVDQRDPERAEAGTCAHLARVVGQVVRCGNPSVRQAARLKALMDDLAGRAEVASP